MSTEISEAVDEIENPLSECKNYAVLKNRYDSSYCIDAANEVGGYSPDIWEVKVTGLSQEQAQFYFEYSSSKDQVDLITRGYFSKGKGKRGKPKKA